MEGFVFFVEKVKWETGLGGFHREHKAKLPYINLIYIRAAIRERTAQDLPLSKVLKYLVEEGLITPQQAKDPDLIFKGYSEYFDYEETAASNPDYEDLLD